VREEKEAVVTREVGEEPAQRHGGRQHEQAEPQVRRQLQRLRWHLSFLAPDDDRGARGGDGLEELLVEPLAGGDRHLVGGDPTLHRFVDGKPAHLPGGVARQRAIRAKLF